MTNTIIILSYLVQTKHHVLTFTSKMQLNLGPYHMHANKQIDSGINKMKLLK